MAKQTFTTGQVLTAAQMTSLQQTAMLGGAASAKTASYTLVAADAGTAVTMNNAGATTITVNTGLFAAGDTVHITNLGAGVCTITAGTATVNSSASLALAQYESGFLDFTSTSAAIFVKGAGAAAAGGGMTLLSTTTLSGATTTISAIDQTYVNLVAIIYGVTNATADGKLRIAPNNVNNNITSFRIDNAPNGTWFYDAIDYLWVSGETNMSRTVSANAFALTIFNYSSSTTQKPFMVSGEFQVTGNLRQDPAFGGGSIGGAGGVTTAITSLVISNSGGDLSTGTVLLYGVK